MEEHHPPNEPPPNTPVCASGSSLGGIPNTPAASEISDGRNVLNVSFADWSSNASEGMMSPTKSLPGGPEVIEHEGSPSRTILSREDCDSLSRTLSKSLQLQRHTVTRCNSVYSAPPTPGAPQVEEEQTPVAFGVHSIQGTRKEMEDAHCAHLSNYAESSASRKAPAEDSTDRGIHSLCSPTNGEAMVLLIPYSFFGVFDGHAGRRAADFAEEHLYRLLSEILNTQGFDTDPKEALAQAFRRTEEEIIAASRSEDWMDGTTAAVVLVDSVKRKCIVGNVGDSEVVLGHRRRGREEAIAWRVLTEVHSLKRNPEEKERVRAEGGREYNGRVGHPKFNPQFVSLAVSRALGDLFFKDEKYTDGKPSGLVAEPYVVCEDLSGHAKEEQFLIIGCDGLWDVVEYQQAVGFVDERLDEDESPQDIAEALVKLAAEQGSSDNITVMVCIV